MLKLSLPLSALLFLSSSNLFAAPAPIESLAGQTFILKGQAFQAKFAITSDGLGRIWRPDGYSTLKWTQEGDDLVATLDAPLESPIQVTDDQGEVYSGVTRLESLVFSFAEGQKIVADVKETYRDIYAPDSGLQETISEYENPALPFMNYSNLKAFTPAVGSLLALPLSGEQSAIIRVTDSNQAVVVEDPLKKAPSSFGISSSDSLVLKLSDNHSVRYSILEDQGLTSVFLAEVKADGEESIFISAGGLVDEKVYETPASVADFAGNYTIPEFEDTQYFFNPSGVAKIMAWYEDGTNTEQVLSWGVEAGLIYGFRWLLGSADQAPTPVEDPALALACQSGKATCEIAQARAYRILAKSDRQLMVLRVLDQKMENGLSSWIHVFNRVSP
jgi:hypothetical protein